MRSHRRATCVAALLVVTAWAARLVALASRAAPEYEIKAAFLFNLVKFVQWPAGAFSGTEDPVIIGILGDDPFGPHLDQILKGQRIDGRPLIVNRLDRVPEAQACHVLFTSASEKKRLREIFALLAGRSVLTVGDVRGFRDSGGMIGLTTDEDRLSFEVDLAAASRARLRISSQLLRLARTVKGAGTP